MQYFDNPVIEIDHEHNNFEIHIFDIEKEIQVSMPPRLFKALINDMVKQYNGWSEFMADFYDDDNGVIEVYTKYTNDE